MTNCRRPTSNSSLLRQLHWLPVPNRIDFKIALLTYKVLVSQQPTYLTPILQPYSASRQNRSSGQHLLCMPRVSTTTQSRSFHCYAPKLWNRLPQALRDLAFSDLPTMAAGSSISQSSGSIIYPGLSAFKTSLKTFLFDTPPSPLVRLITIHGASVIGQRILCPE